MFIVHELTVNVTFTDAQPRLASIVQAGGLTGPSLAAYDGLMRVGPFGDKPGMSKLVRVSLLSPVERGGTLTVPLRWEAAGVAGGLFPVLDADLNLVADGEHKTRVTLTGCYRPPFGLLGAGLDRALLHHAAKATFHALLSSVADTITVPVLAQQAAEQPGLGIPVSEPGMP